MNILVTGADGQLGSEIRLLSCASPHRFIFTDVAQLDICDREAVRETVLREKADVIVNCAAYTNVEAAEDNPQLAERLNAGAPLNLALAMKETGGLLVHVSTDYVFGNSGSALAHSPIGEDEAPAPLGVYGLTKFHGEQAVIGSGCRYVILRTAWLYSEFGKNFVKTMLSLTSSKPEIKVVDDQRGTPTYARDLADVILKIIDSDLPSSNPAMVFNYTDEGECTWYEFASRIAELSGHKLCTIHPCLSSEYPSKVVRPTYSVLDKTRIKAALGISIPQWEDSLKACLGNLPL